MKTVFVSREKREEETRVALIPQDVSILTRLGFEIVVEKGLGKKSGFADEAYVKAGATLADDPAKALAEAEGLEKKADAMAKYGEAAKMDLQLQVAKVYCEQLPEIAKGIAEAYTKVGNITMYGDQSGAIAAGVIDKSVQLSDGLSKGLGIDLKSLLAGAFGAKILDAAGKGKDA